MYVIGDGTGEPLPPEGQEPDLRHRVGIAQ